MLTLFPTQAAAQDAEMSLPEFEDFVYRAGLLDRDDPVAEWKAFGERIERVGSFLDGVSELRVVAEDTDLTIGVGGRRGSARRAENFPDGEIFTGPVETSVEGTIRFTYPAVFQGREVDDVRLRFEAGEVVEATAAGLRTLREMIAVDDGARRRGEFAFGLNEAVTASPARSSSTRRSAGRCTSRSGRRIRRPAAQPLGAPLGPDLRPPTRRRGVRRRRALLPGRRVPPRACCQRPT